MLTSAVKVPSIWQQQFAKASNMGKSSGKDKKRRRDESSSDAGSSPERSKKHKKHKKHKGSSRDKDEKARLKEAKRFVKQALKQGEGQPEVDRTPLDAATQIEQLSADDYFQRNAEFSAWLREERGTFFNNLSSEDSRELFGKFVEQWNARKLAARYYAGLVGGGAAMRRTQHQWGVRGNADALDTAAVGMAAAMEEEREAQAAQRVGQKVERRKWRTEQKELLEEMLPKATGREALVEKRIARREEAKARDASPELQRLPGGGDVMGGDDSFAAAQAREAHRGQRLAQRKAVQQEALSHKAAAAAAVEDARMAQFRALIGQAGGKLSIPKRS